MRSVRWHAQFRMACYRQQLQLKHDFSECSPAYRLPSRAQGFIPTPYTDETSMLYSIDLIAAGTLVVDHMLPVLSLFIALALAIVFID